MLIEIRVKTLIIYLSIRRMKIVMDKNKSGMSR